MSANILFANKKSKESYSMENVQYINVRTDQDKVVKFNFPTQLIKNFPKLNIKSYKIKTNLATTTLTGEWLPLYSEDL